VPAARREIARLGAWRGAPAPGPHVAPVGPPAPAAGQAVLSSWHWLLDDGTLQTGEVHLAGTRRAPRLHLSAATAAEIGARPGSPVTVSTARGSITLPLVLAGLPDRVVWVPTHSPGSHLFSSLAAVPGDVVSIAPAAEVP